MKLFVFVLMTGLLTGCNKSANTQLPDSGCDVSLGCPLVQYSSEVQLLLPGDIFPEQLFDLSVKFTHRVTHVKAHLEGISMFMGKIPVMLQYQGREQRYLAKTIVGRCGNEQMKWRLILSWQQDGEPMKAHREFVVRHSL